MSDENLPYAVRKLYLNVIIRAFADATYKMRFPENQTATPDKKYETNCAGPTYAEQRYARMWLMHETDNFILVHDLAGLPHRKTIRIARQLKKDGWPNIMPKLKREITKYNRLMNSMNEWQFKTNP
jgi:hypothetical protein